MTPVDAPDAPQTAQEPPSEARTPDGGSGGSERDRALAALDRREVIARAADEEDVAWWYETDSAIIVANSNSARHADHIAAADPAWTLGVIAALRAIIERHDVDDECYCAGCGFTVLPGAQHVFDYEDALAAALDPETPNPTEGES